MRLLERVTTGKARAKALPSVLTERGYLQAILRVSRRLQKETANAVGTLGWQKQIFDATDVDWPAATSPQIKASIKELDKLIRSVPSALAPGLKAIMDTEAEKVVNDTHRATGKRFKHFSVDPVFALRNDDAVKALSQTSTLFFSDEYARQADRFTSRVRSNLVAGIDQGLGSREIAAAMRADFGETVAHPAYWETVAAVHVNRARSWSSMKTYAENGVTTFQAVAVLDNRTTSICKMMDGKIIGVEHALNTFDDVEENATSLDDVKRLAPLMTMKGPEIRIRGQVVSTVNPKGGFTGTLNRAGMEKAGISNPPYHHRCRTSVVPVIGVGDVPVAPKVGAKQVKVPKPKTTKPPKRKGRRTAKEKLIDAAAKIRQAKIEEIARDGLVPGSMLDEQALYGKTRGRGAKLTTDEHLKASMKFSEDLAEHFQQRGRAILSLNPDAAKAFDTATKKGATWKDRRTGAQSAVLRAKKLGIDAIPEKEREARKKAFVEEVVRKTKNGQKGTNNKYKPSSRSALSADDKERVALFAGQYFDAWGPAAEATIKRMDTFYFASGSDRVHYSDTSRYLAFTDRRTFFHEFSHGIEYHATSPRRAEFASPFNRAPRQRESYWANRVQSKDPNPERKLSALVPGSGYADKEIAKKDKWAKAYMGKIYSRGSTEVVAMMSEGLGGNEHLWRAQLEEDPSMILEFIGYMDALIQGEVKRQAGIPGRVG